MSNDINKKINDTFFASIGEAHLQDIDSIPENLDLDMAEMNSWFESFNNQLKRTSKKEARKRAYSKLLKLVAVVFIASTVVFTGLFAGVEAFRVEILNLIISVEDTHTLVNTNNLNEFRDQGVILPEFLPKGLTLFSYEKIGNIHKTIFKDAEEHFINIHQADIETQIQFDTEQAEVVQLTIDELEVYFILKGKISTFYWVDKSYNYSIVSNFEYESLIKIIKNMK